MPHYHFNLKTALDTIHDLEGMELPDERSARSHAGEVARELTTNRDLRAMRLWRLSVCDGYGKSHFELLLAPLHPSICQLPSEIRASVEDLCQKTASLNDAIKAVRMTVFQVRGTIARSEGMPYVAALDGIRL